MRNLSLFVATAIALGGGCSQGVSVDNGNPNGTVGGVVLDASNEAPIGGATVKIVSGGSTRTAMTDMDGQFAVTKVPSGSFILTVTQMGYVSAQITDQLAGSVGNFPVHNPSQTIGPLGLLPATGSFTVHVVDETGGPVAGLQLSGRTHVRQVIYQNGQPSGEGAYEVAATTGMDGSATFTGLPVYGALAGLTVDLDQLDVAVPPTKIMGTEIYDFLGLVQAFHLNGLQSSAQVIHLAGPNTALAILDSNIDYLRGVAAGAPPAFTAPVGSLIPINGPINVSFNQAINPSSLRAQFLDADGKLLATTAMAMVSLNTVQITPSAALQSGKRYNLILHATPATEAAANGATQLDVTAPFFTEPPTGASITVVANSVQVQTPAAGPITVTFELSEPIGVGKGQTAALDCVAFYEITGSSGFNNDPNTPFQGDWKIASGSTPPTNLVCRQPVGATGDPQINVTGLQPLESTNTTANQTLITGFTSRFQITIGNAPTNMNEGPCIMQTPRVFPGCTQPGVGTKIHLIFSRQDPSTTVKRVNGAPVPDNIIVTL
jgi:hypothetical protein